MATPTAQEKVVGSLIVELRARDYTAQVFQSLAKAMSVLNKNAVKQQKQMSAVVQKTSREATKTTDTYFDKLSKRLGFLTDDTRKKLNAFSYQVKHYLSFTIAVQLVASSIRAMKNAIKLAISFEDAAYAAASVSGYFGDEFDKAVQHIRKVSIELAATTKFTTMEVAESFYTLASAGIDVFSVTKENLLPILEYATATGISLAEATKDVVVAMKQFKLSMQDTQRIVDAFTGTITNTLATAESLREAFRYVGPAAAAMGKSIEETSAALGILINNGVQGSQAGQMLRMVMLKLLDPTEKAIRTFRKMGYTMAELSPEYHSLTYILRRLQLAQFDATRAAEIFSARSALGAIILSQNVDALEELTRTLRENAGITEKIAEKRLASMEGQVKLIKSAYEALSLEILTHLNPAIKALSAALRSYVIPFLGELFKLFNNLLGGLVTTAKAFPVFKHALIAVISSLMLFSIYLTLSFFTLKVYGPLLITFKQGLGMVNIELFLLVSALMIAFRFLRSFTKQTRAADESTREHAKNLKLFANSILSLFTAMTSVVIFSKIFSKLILFSAAHILETTGRVTLLSRALVAAAFPAGKLATVLEWLGISAVRFYAGLGLLIGGLTTIAVLFTHFDEFSNSTKILVAALGALSVAIGLVIIKLQGLKAVLATHPLGLLLVGISALVGALAGTGGLGKAISAVTGAFQDFLAGLGIGKSRAEEYAEKIATVTDKFAEYRDKLVEYFKIRQKIEEYEKRGIKLTEEQIKNYDDLSEEQRDYLELTKQLLEREQELSSILSTIGKYLKENFKSLSDYMDAMKKVEDKTKTYNEYLKEQSDLEKDIYYYSSQYVKALFKSGDAVMDVETAYQRYIEASSRLQNVSQKLADAETDKIIAEIEAEEKASKLSDTERKMYIINDKLLKTLTDLITLERIHAALTEFITELVEDYSKYDEKVVDIQKDVIKSHLKVIKAEKELAKVRRSLIDVTDKFFQELAKAGLVDEQMISLYKNMKYQGASVMKMNIQWTRILGKYSNISGTLVRLLDIYVNELDSGADASTAWTKALELTGSAIDKVLSPSDIQFIQSYGLALSRLHNKTMSFASYATKAVAPLVNIGAVPESVITGYYDVISVTDNLTDKEYELGKAIEENKEEISRLASLDIIHNLTRGYLLTKEWAKAVENIGKKTPFLGLFSKTLMKIGEAGFGAISPVDSVLKALRESGLQSLRDLADAIEPFRGEIAKAGNDYAKVESIVSKALSNISGDTATLIGVFMYAYRKSYETYQNFQNMITNFGGMKTIIEDLKKSFEDLTEAIPDWSSILDISDEVTQWSTLYSVVSGLDQLTLENFKTNAVEALRSILHELDEEEKKTKKKESFWYKLGRSMNIYKLVTYAGLAKAATTLAGVLRLPFSFLQEGGIVKSTTIGVLGERGPEAIVPLPKYNILQTYTSRERQIPATIVVHGDINISGVSNVDEFMRELEGRLSKMI